MTILMQYSAMTETYLTRIHASDAALFPNALPFSQLLSWHHASPPDFFITLGSASGCIIALPLPHDIFTGLCDGSLEEKDVTATHISEAALILLHGTKEEKKTLGVHFWHVERTDTWWSETDIPFATILQDYINNIRTQHGIGSFSALTASTQGEGLFRKVGFGIAGIFDIVQRTPDSSLTVIHYKESQLQKIADQDNEVVYACKMMKL